MSVVVEVGVVSLEESGVSGKLRASELEKLGCLELGRLACLFVCFVVSDDLLFHLVSRWMGRGSNIPVSQGHGRVGGYGDTWESGL